VVRITKDIFKNSQIGIYYTGAGGETSTTHNLAADYSFNFKDIYYLRGAHVFLLTPREEMTVTGFT